MKFKGKIALWYWSIIVVVNLYSLYKIILGVNNLFIIVAALALMDIIFLPNIIRNYILISNDIIYLYFGFFRDSLAIKDIESVVSTHMPISSSAASLDRLIIKSRNNEIIASIKEKEKFMNELKKKSPYKV